MSIHGYMTPERWSDSQELRESVRQELREWAAGNQGGWPNIGFPDCQPWATPSEAQRMSVRSPYDPDKVHHYNDAVAAMYRYGKEIEAVLLVGFYVYHLSPESLAKHCHRKYGGKWDRDRVVGKLYDAEFDFACLT